MRSAFTLVAVLSMWISSALAQANSTQVSRALGSNRQSDTELIQQIETEFLKAERTTDPTVMERVLADDYVNLVPRGIGPGKEELVKTFQAHQGEAPPYSVRQQDMHIFVLSEISAIAAFAETFVAKENQNVAHQDITHVFTKAHGTWTLRLSRTSSSASTE